MFSREQLKTITCLSVILKQDTKLLKKLYQLFQCLLIQVSFRTQSQGSFITSLLVLLPFKREIMNKIFVSYIDLLNTLPSLNTSGETYFDTVLSQSLLPVNLSICLRLYTYKQLLSKRMQICAQRCYQSHKENIQKLQLFFFSAKEIGRII